MFRKVESYDHASSLDCSYFENFWRELYCLLVFRKNIPLLTLDLSSSSLTSASSSVIVKFAYIDLQAFPLFFSCYLEGYAT